MKPKLINGKVWIYVESGPAGGYQKLPEDDPKYKDILLWIDSQRFVELLDWVYRQRNSKKVVSPEQTYRAEGFALIGSKKLRWTEAP
jgi:hypothetical protein